MEDEKQDTQLTKQLALHRAVDQAYEAIQAALIEAGDSFMVAVWSSERSDHSNQIRLVTRTTWQFPVSEYATALELLRADTKKDAARISDALRPGPLELASLVNRARQQSQAAQATQHGDDQPIPTDDSHAH